MMAKCIACRIANVMREFDKHQNMSCFTTLNQLMSQLADKLRDGDTKDIIDCQTHGERTTLRRFFQSVQERLKTPASVKAPRAWNVHPTKKAKHV